MSKKVIIVSIGIVLIWTISSCAGHKASHTVSKHSGTSVEELQRCKTRDCILSKEVASIINSEKEENGELIEVYAVEQNKGSAERAMTTRDILLDLFTCGLWEVVRTPMEEALKKDEAIHVRVYYDKNENIKRIELVQSKYTGEKIGVEFQSYTVKQSR